jgi:hypothetical protein
MKDALGFKLKEGWVIASVSVLVVYLIGQLRPESELGLTATSDWLLIWMLLLSLPASLIAATLIQNLFWLYPPTLSEIIFVWAVMFAAGYWQWHIFVPWLLPKDQPLITLKLERKDKKGLSARDIDADLAYDSVWIIEDERAAAEIREEIDDESARPPS